MADLHSSDANAQTGPPPALRVSVRSLCEFGAKAGDLDFRFAPAPTAQEGIAGHQWVQGRRGATYQSEVALAAGFEGLIVRGRADGFEAAGDTDTGRARVEEIKTFRGEFDAIRQNHRALHLAQARTYGWMLCERHDLVEIDVALVYLDIATNEETVVEARCRRDELRADFEMLCRRFMHWALQEGRHRSDLARALDGLAFPHAGFRAGQRELAEGVYRAASSRRCLIAQAPTGIGKTVATIFPLLRGWASQKTDKLFFLTAKTSGRGVALEALDLLARPAASVPLRVVELAAREKVCEYPGRACNGEACPLARGFYDRLPAARDQAVATPRLTVAAARDIARAHVVCPYFLAQEMVRWADVVVADYNYYFDTSAFLFALTRQEDWRVAVLVDEAHNLLDRARGMYSAELRVGDVEAARLLAPAHVRPAVARVRREWRALQKAQVAEHAAQDEVPEGLHDALKDVVAVLADHFAASASASASASSRPAAGGTLLEAATAQAPLQRFFFDALQFTRLCAGSLAGHSVFESVLGGGGEGGRLDAAREADGNAIAIRNLVPAPFLQRRFAASMTTVCFSGTIAPFAFYRDMLGLPADAGELEVASPFRAAQLEVRIAADLSTRFRDRTRSMGRLVDLVAAQFERRPGNYLVFLSSFDFLAAAHALFARRHPSIATWTQSAAMREAERDAFVSRFRPGGRGVGFAVLGGAFGEGVDLPGERLIGAFIASLGLPQHDARNEAMRERIEARFGGDGHAYTYLYPGLRKVVQAAGRVIRTEDDTGVLWLLDDRFARPEVRRLLPPWWRVDVVDSRRLDETAVAPAARPPSDDP
ncbi:ATP-dependent DNA helicase [Variovorax sp. PvP013]|uniref:ATP-dependent DNA helicase n=1 Tax=Variovorax sp. PvP013 TaxID=3156435 RepID=UPI003D23FDC7